MPLSLESVADDLLYDILSHLSVPDILCLRKVSRKFQHLTHERSVWVTAYRQATILRPPGPFQSQSAQDLEQNLKMSLRLETNLTSPSPRPVSHRTIENRPERMKLVMGRYLIVAGETLRCYDLDLRDDAFAQPIAVYNIRSGVIDCSVVNIDTSMPQHKVELQCAVVNHSMEPSEKIYFLALQVSRDTAEFELKKRVQVPGIWFISDFKISGDFLVITTAGDPVLVHIPTYQVYNLPPPQLETIAGLPGYSIRRVNVITTTHLLVMTESRHDKCIIEAFPLPETELTVQPRSSVETPRLLTRSHVGFHPFGINQPMLLSSSTARPEDYCTDTTINMSLLALIHTPGNTHFHNEIGILSIVLESPSQECSVAPITVSYSPSPFSGNEYIFHLCGTASGGLARVTAGFCTSNTIWLSAFTVTGGSADGVGERSIVCRKLPLEKSRADEILSMAWDGLIGRLCIPVPPSSIVIWDYV